MSASSSTRRIRCAWRDLHGRAVDLEATRFEAGHIQNVVDQERQSFDVAVDDADGLVVPLAQLAQRARLEQVQLKADGGERRVQFVRRGVQNLGLEAAGLLEPQDFVALLQGVAQGVQFLVVRIQGGQMRHPDGALRRLEGLAPRPQRNFGAVEAST